MNRGLKVDLIDLVREEMMDVLIEEIRGQDACQHRFWTLVQKQRGFHPGFVNWGLVSVTKAAPTATASVSLGFRQQAY